MDSYCQFTAGRLVCTELSLFAEVLDSYSASVWKWSCCMWMGGLYFAINNISEEVHKEKITVKKNERQALAVSLQSAGVCSCPICFALQNGALRCVWDDTDLLRKTYCMNRADIY